MPTAGEYRVVEAVVRTRRLPVALRMCGIGPRRAAAFCAELERGARPRGLALLGWAGGLRDDLVVGDIVIADRALSAARSDVSCLALPLPGTVRIHRGPVLTADHVVAAPAAKRAAAACGALAVEMEAYPLAAWAAQHEAPLVHGRVILDTVDDALPALDGVLDGYGRLQIRPLLGALARRP
jgi:nucleoside phosphorylase